MLRGLRFHETAGRGRLGGALGAERIPRLPGEKMGGRPLPPGLQSRAGHVPRQERVRVRRRGEEVGAEWRRRCWRKRGLQGQRADQGRPAHGWFLFRAPSEKSGCLLIIDLSSKRFVMPKKRKKNERTKERKKEMKQENNRIPSPSLSRGCSLGRVPTTLRSH